MRRPKTATAEEASALIDGAAGLASSQGRLEKAHAARDALLSAGLSQFELFEALTTKSIQAKEEANSNRCKACWHDLTHRCICQHLRLPREDVQKMRLNVRILVLMHHKEYLSAGDDAKLLLAMLPPSHCELFVFGRSGDLDRLEQELAIDPVHNLVLWPSEDAATVDTFCAGLPGASPWRGASSSCDDCSKSDTAGDTSKTDTSGDTARERPVLRVLVLDGVYNHARLMARTLRRRLPAAIIPREVALHPTTLSVYHRAQKSYGASSGASVAASAQPEALRICTVEAVALLLRELGEVHVATAALVQAVELNNDALRGAAALRPTSGLQVSGTSGAGKRARRKQERRVEPPLQSSTPANPPLQSSTSANPPLQSSTSASPPLQSSTPASPPLQGTSAVADTPASATDGTRASAHWLTLEQPFELMGRSLAPPWEAMPREMPFELAPVAWAAPPAADSDEAWEHMVTWCERPDDGGRVAIHRFTPRDNSASACDRPRANAAAAAAAACEASGDPLLLAALERLAVDDSKQVKPIDDDALSALAASNVGGHHSTRDVFDRLEVQATGLPAATRVAVERAAKAEAAALGRAPFALAAAAECWFNMLPPSGWNTLHTHPGARYACTYFVACGTTPTPAGDGGTASSRLEAALGGRLVLLPLAPAQLATHHMEHVLHPPDASSRASVDVSDEFADNAPTRADAESTETPNASTPNVEDADAAARRMRFLLVDPVPGSLIVFPSFLAHFVAPVRVNGGEPPDGPPRVSIAANFAEDDAPKDAPKSDAAPSCMTTPTLAAAPCQASTLAAAATSPVIASPPAPTHTRIVCISDTHGQHRQLTMPPGDVLIHAGDFTSYAKQADVVDFNAWLGTLPYRHKLIVLGNHEANAEWVESAAKLLSNGVLLCHRGIGLDTGSGGEPLSVFGTDFFWPAGAGAWAPPYGAVPTGIDVLIAHGPCEGHVDGGNGCAALLEHVRRVRPRLVVCGHIHEARGVVRGQGAGLDGVLFVNAANARGREGARARSRGPYQPLVVELPLARDRDARMCAIE